MNPFRFPFRCNFCGLRLKTKIELNSHIGEVHTGERPYKCHNCQKAFKQRSHLNNHIKYVHSGSDVRRHCCPFCLKCFKTHGDLLGHIRSHLNEKPFECHHCRKTFKTSSILNVHLRIHSSSKSHCCPFCGKDFPQLNSLDNHIRSHIREKPFQCQFCEEEFVSSDVKHRHQLRRHQRELGRKKLLLSCTFCGHQSNQKEQLENHIRSHIKEKPYGCKHCPKEFASAGGLRYHLRTHGQDEERNGESSLPQRKSQRHRVKEVQTTVNRRVQTEEDPEVVAKKEARMKLERRIRIQQKIAKMLRNQIEARKSTE